MLDRPDLTRRSTWRRLLEGVSTTSPGGEPPMNALGPDDPAGAAWRWCLDAGPLPGFADLPGHRPDGTGPRPVLADRDDLAIEVWTECELAVLHAGFRRLVEVRTSGEPTSSVDSALERRLRDAVSWHLEHTQPDNATTHPWGLHALLELGQPIEDAIDDAGGMLHAMQAAAAGAVDGGPDRLSLWIVADALATLERLPDARLGDGFEASADPSDIDPASVD